MEEGAMVVTQEDNWGMAEEPHSIFRGW